MKSFIGIFIFLLLINLGVPVLYCNIYTELPQFDMVVENSEETPPPQSEAMVTLKDKNSGQTFETTLKDFLIGAAACEMPALYNKEAIKAQMVAIHSYYLYCQQNPDHIDGGYITVDESSLSGYASKGRLMEFWQSEYYDYRAKFEQCADEIINDVVIYDGQPALTSYYAVSCGKTADSKDVWGTALPYLVSVDSSHDQISDNYLQTKNYEKDGMYSLLQLNFPNIKLDESTPESWFGDVIYTESGYASYVYIGGDMVPADQVRNVLGLPSTCMMVFYEDESFTIATKGYGHGVGLSQFGANQMAGQGKTYEEILSHYYPNTEIGII